MHGFDCHGARHMKAYDLPEMRKRSTVGAETGVIEKGVKFVISEVGVDNLDWLNQKVERSKLEGRVTKGGHPGFPRGHGAPVGYSNSNPKVRVLTMQGP